MPTRISQKELEDLGFFRAGSIRPDDAGRICRAHIDPDVAGCIVYAHIVGDQPMKFGSTAPSLKARMRQNASTIRKIIELQDGRSARDAKWHHAKWDEFKHQAPAVIRTGRSIEVWATLAHRESIGKCAEFEGILNDRYETIRHGWAMKRN